jgi:hypothetical protein
MFGSRTFKADWLRDAVVVAAALGLGLFASRAFGVEPPPGKMAKQIDVMERILDQVLIDSPNFLVSGRGNTRGLYVPQFGIVMSFDATLVEKGKSWDFDFGKGFRVEEIDGKKVILLEDEIHAGDEEAPEPPKTSKTPAPSRKSGESSQERLYKRGKAELVDVLLDYGDTLTSLEKGKWIALVAFLHDAKYFDDRDMSKLILKARVDDLRLYSADKLSEQDMVKRIVEVEY